MTLLTHCVPEGMGDQSGVWEQLDKRMSIVMGCVGVRVHEVMTELQKGKEGTSGTSRKWSIQVESIKLGGLSSALAEARRRYFVVSLLLLHAVSLKSSFSHQGRETSVLICFGVL